MVLNFDTFANVVNALGGVKMYFPEPVYDAYSGLKQLTPGCVSLDGLHALQVVRARHLQYKGGRGDHQPSRVLALGEPERPGPYPPQTTSSSGCWPAPWPSRASATRSPTSSW